MGSKESRKKREGKGSPREKNPEGKDFPGRGHPAETNSPRKERSGRGWGKEKIKICRGEC